MDLKSDIYLNRRSHRAQGRSHPATCAARHRILEFSAEQRVPMPTHSHAQLHRMPYRVLCVRIIMFVCATGGRWAPHATAHNKGCFSYGHSFALTPHDMARAYSSCAGLRRTSCRVGRPEHSKFEYGVEPDHLSSESIWKSPLTDHLNACQLEILGPDSYVFE